MKTYCLTSFVAALSMAFALQSCQSTPDNVFDQIVLNIYERSVKDINPVKASDDVDSYLPLLTAEGSFSDIDYADRRQSPWEPSTHSKRLLAFTNAYIHPDSRYYADDKLYEAICHCLQYWYDADPRSANWWHQYIGWPQDTGWVLCMMRHAKKHISAELEAAYARRVLEFSADIERYTGANMQDIALVWLYMAVLTKDETTLSRAVDYYFQPVCFTVDEGLQYDYSYHQHAHQLYSAGYGAVVLSTFFKVAYYIKGTPYERPAYTDIISGYIRYGILPINRGAYTLFSSGGRGHVSRTNALYNKGLAPMMAKMAELDRPEFKQLYLNAAERLSERQPANYGVEPWHHHYWTSDYSVHQRPAYTFDIRTNSTRTCRSENGNLENLKGYFVGDGCTQMVVDGDEYYNIFPTWSWQHIPGTTVPCLPEVPLDKSWSVYGLSDFTGGVDDDRYGCMTYHYVDTKFDINTQARKSWFCFDNEIVCLGAAINSSNPNPVHTTVNQCLLKGDVTVEDADGRVQILDKGDHNLTNLRWIHHNKVSYYFPDNANVAVSGKECVGTWYDINQTMSKDEVRQNIFLTYIDHGPKVKNGSYVYYVLPATAGIAEAKQAMDKLTVCNTPELQYVYNDNLHILQVVFHEAGTANVANTTLIADAPCTVMLTGIGDSRTMLYAADPTFKQCPLHLTLTLPGQAAKHVGITFKNDTGHLGQREVFDVTNEPINQ